MTDQSVSNDACRTGRSFLDNAKHEGELSAVLVEQLRRAPTLSQIARSILAEAIRPGMVFPNPDAIFIHRESDNGPDPEPLSLTHAFLRALTGDRTYVDDVHAVLSMRRDSADPMHEVPGWDLDAVRSLFARLLVRLPESLMFGLDEYWTADRQTFTRIPGESPVSGTRVEILETLQTWVFSHAIKFAVGKREMITQDEQRLYSVVDDANSKGRYAVMLVTPEGASLPLIGTFVATAKNIDVVPLTAHDSLSGVYLFSPATGVEKFATLHAMETALQQRLEHEDSRDVLLGLLSLEHQILCADNDWSLLHLEYAPLKNRPAARFMADLQERQRNDINYLLAQAPLSSGDPDAVLQMFDDASRLDDLDQALNIRYLDLLAYIHERGLPDWLRHAASDDRKRYDELAAEQARCEERVEALLVGLESQEVHGREQIAAYLRRHLGYTLDPATVIVNLPDEMPFADKPLKPVYKGTLLDFALEGLPEVELRLGPGIDVDRGYAHPGLDFSFVRQLVKELDLKQSYGREVERRYREQNMLSAMSALRASNIALSAWAAKLQGHLSGRGLALVERVQANLGGTSTLKLGALHLKGGNRRLEDAVVMRELKGDEAFYVLYVPGQPGGRDMFDFDSWRKLSFEVGSWTGNAQGAQYLLDQTVVKADHHVIPYIGSIQLKPAGWSADSVQFVAINGVSLNDALSGFSYYKIEQMLARNQFVSATRMQHITEQHRMTRVLLDHRITALNEAYDRFGITPWRAAARGECERLIDNRLKTLGVPGRIDPDTVFCDIEGKTGQGEPDFGRYTTLQCLTDLFMIGYSSEDYTFEPSATLYSSIGQDLSALSGAFIDEMIRNSNFADEYIVRLRRHTWSMTNSPPKNVQAVFARKTHYEMRRDALIEFTAGHINADQYDWLVRMIASNDRSIAGNTAQAPGTLHGLIMEYKTIADIYIFKPDKANARHGTLAYTPGAPDGRLFRKEDDIVHSVARPGMSRYYYDHATYKAQRIIGTLMQKLEVSPMIDGKLYSVTHSLPITDYQNLHSIVMQHLIVDIDSQTESVNERRLLNTYKFVRRHGGHLAGLNPITKVVWTAIHATVDMFRGIYAYQDGDRARARGFFIKAVKGALKTAKQVRKIRKEEKLKRLGQTAKKSNSWSLPGF